MIKKIEIDGIKYFSVVLEGCETYADIEEMRNGLITFCSIAAGVCEDQGEYTAMEFIAPVFRLLDLLRFGNDQLDELDKVVNLCKQPKWVEEPAKVLTLKTEN